MRALLAGEVKEVVVKAGDIVHEEFDGDALELVHVVGGTAKRQRLSFVIDQAACP